MGESFSYQVQPKQHESDSGTPPTQAEKEQMRAPGRAIYNAGSGEYHVEMPQEVGREQERTPYDVLSNPLNFVTDTTGRRVHNIAAADPKSTVVPVPNGSGGVDYMPLSAALNARLYDYDSTGKLLPTFVVSPRTDVSRPSTPVGQQDGRSAQEQQGKAAQDSPAEDRVPELQGDQTLGRIAEQVGDAPVYQLISQAALGEPLTEAKAQSIAQALGVDPENIRNVHAALLTEYSAVGTAALMAAGVAEEKCAEAMAWLAEHRKGDLLDAVNDMVRQSKRSTTALKALGRDFVKATGGSFSDAELEQMTLPAGARWHRGERGELLITIEGWGTTSAQGALRQGVLKV
jgi:hypothetical protein